MDADSQGVAVFHVENIGGIEETDVELTPGVTVLSGRNATNRTSFLQAIMAAMGSDQVKLKGDADEGVVELKIGGKTYVRQFERRSRGVVSHGDSYLDDSSLADLFAFLLERNEGRRAVARGDDPREIIIRPVDTDKIEAEIKGLESERDQIDAELEHIQDRKRDLPELEQRRNELKDRIEETRAALAEKETEIESLDGDIEEHAMGEDDVDSALSELRETRSELEDVRYNIDTEEASLESLQSELRELRDELDEVPATPESNSDIEERLQALREEKQRLDDNISLVRSAISFNEEMLESRNEHVFRQDGGAAQDNSVTDQLVKPNAQVTCWTCGSKVSKSSIETTLDELRERRAEKLDTVSELEDEISSLVEDRRSRRERIQRRETVERRIEKLEDEIEDRERRLDEYSERADGLRDKIQALEDEVEAADDGTSELLERHREANELEFKLGHLESDLDSVTEEIEIIEEQLDKESTLEARREEIGDELADLRTRIEQIEQEAVEQFNEHMAAILDILEYGNIERIWIERLDSEVREGQHTVEQTQFELHVVRTTSNGATYEDTIDHLSESEREVTGLIFALAGYLVHELYEEVPFMLLDSLEAIDANRIAGLVDYYSDFAPYLVVALLTEDAQALDDDYDRVTDI